MDIFKISLPDGIRIFFETINYKLLHQDYERVNKIAEDYCVYVTGEGASAKLLRFVPRESEEMFAQRLRLTQITTPDIAGGCVKPMYKVGRTPASKVISWGDAQKTENNKKLLAEVAEDFYGKQSVDEYLTYRMVELDSTDPNSFIVVEFTTLNGGTVDPANANTKAIPYPFEVNSKEAVNYQYRNNILQFLVARQDITIKDDKDKECEGHKFIVYLSDNSIVATQIHKTMVDKYKADNSPVEIDILVDNLNVGTKYLFTTKEKGNTNSRFFAVSIYEHKIGFVPAQRVGTIRDLATRGRTRVPLIHLAKPYLEKSIKTISEFDLTNCLHVFPQKIQYSEACPGFMEKVPGSDDEYNLVGCLKGHTPEGQKCKACHGSGFVVHKSAADLIQIAMPKNISEMVSLENFLVYKYPPTELLEFQKKLALYEFRYLAQRAVYNSEVFSKQEIATTATEKTIDLDSVYDTLSPFAINYSETWVFVMKCIASLRDLGQGFTCSHVFPKDFKMKSTTQLLDDLQKANSNGAPSHIKKAITRDITSKYYVDDPGELNKIETKDKYFPFPGKSEAQINFIMANNGTTDKIKIFFNHFDLIFADLEFDAAQKQTDFYKMEEPMQRQLIDAKIEEYAQDVAEEVAEATAKAFSQMQGLDPNADPNTDPNAELDPTE